MLILLLFPVVKVHNTLTASIDKAKKEIWPTSSTVFSFAKHNVLGPKKKSLVKVAWPKKLVSVGRKIIFFYSFFFFLNPEYM